ncbi:MAG: hypothetical protein NWQ72_03190 [Ilumatobacteraceae bacterium]|jgi:hypothetical protein|nr:hypothetical protein [Ilumatobacteraceae bacterium]MDP5068810.1 hypothetical protein [Ilumatobacteraceae bacterium]
MNSLWASTDIETLKNLALGLSGASIVVGLILMKVVSSIIGKIISLVIFVAIALAGYSQRAQVIDCANSVKAQATATASVNTTCTFFGQEVKVKIPQPSQ